jgi:hypothetical protein
MQNKGDKYEKKKKKKKINQSGIHLYKGAWSWAHVYKCSEEKRKEKKTQTTMQ